MRKISLLCFAVALATSSFAQSALPNGDFETWNMKFYDSEDTGWFDSNGLSLASDDSLTVWKVPGFSGQAVHMETAIVGADTMIAYISNKSGNQISSAGGVPYSQQPAAITGYFRCNTVSDTGLIWVRFKSAGTVVSSDTFRFPAGSTATFTSFSFPLSLSVVPDTVIIVAAACNVLRHPLTITSGSWLELDQLAFTGTGITQIIPGGSFDSWLPDTLQAPAGWQLPPGVPTGVSRTGDAYSGSYAVQLITLPGVGGARPAAISTGVIGAGGPPRGGLPYTGMVDTLVGYYKYTPGGGTDSGLVNVSLSGATGPVGGGRISLPAASAYTFFQVPISATGTPDTMRIDIASSRMGPGAAATAGSTLKVDKLYLKLSTPALSVGSIHTAVGCVAYPNPVTDMLNLQFGETPQSNIAVTIYDARGNMVLQKSYSPAATLSVPTQQLPAGMYFYQAGTFRGRFVKLDQ